MITSTLSRKQKNILLLLANSAFALITIFYKFFAVAEPKFVSGLNLWLVCFPIVLLTHIIATNKQNFIKIRDAFLFLLIGGAIGQLLGNIIKEDSTPILYLFWIIPALIIAVLHYSRSKNDRYLNT